MELVCNGRNLYIVDKTAETFNAVSVEDGTMIVKNGEVNIASNGTIPVVQIYACMYCPGLRNITLIIRAEDIYKVSFVMNNDTEFEKTLKWFKVVCASATISEQNKKINGYAAGLIEKLKEGIELTIIDSKDESEVPVCPVCGVQCDPGIPYCMECGASL